MVCRKRPTHFSLKSSMPDMYSRFLNDGGSVTAQQPSLNSPEVVTAQACVLFSRRRPLSFYSVLLFNLADCKVFQCNRFFFHGVMTPSLMS